MRQILSAGLALAKYSVLFIADIGANRIPADSGITCPGKRCRNRGAPNIVVNPGKLPPKRFDPPRGSIGNDLAAYAFRTEHADFFGHHAMSGTA